MSSESLLNFSNNTSQATNFKVYTNLTPDTIPIDEENSQYLNKNYVTPTPGSEDHPTNNEPKKKILIVEDSIKLRTILMQILSEYFDVTGFSDASQALEVCSSLKPDIILLDIMLPGSIDGFAFLRILKKDKNLTHIPVILMSLLSTEGIILEGLKLGANDYIVKPFDIRQLDLKIRNYLNINKELREKTIIEQNIRFEVKNDGLDILKKFEIMLENTILKDADMTIEDYARQLNMSLSTLERVIKKNFKMSPSKYIQQRKLEKADILIRSNQGMSIKEIALTLGFSSLSYFCRCYKLHYGFPPSGTNKE
jgi:DNA-binding response OmpR family regulator